MIVLPGVRTFARAVAGVTAGLAGIAARMARGGHADWPSDVFASVYAESGIACARGSAVGDAGGAQTLTTIITRNGVEIARGVSRARAYGLTSSANDAGCVRGATYQAIVVHEYADSSAIRVVRGAARTLC